MQGVIGHRTYSAFGVMANGVGILVAWVLAATGLSSIVARWEAVRAREAATRESAG